MHLPSANRTTRRDAKLNHHPAVRLRAIAALSACLILAAGCGPAPAAPTSAMAPTAEAMVIATVSAGVAADADVAAAEPTSPRAEPTAPSDPSLPAAETADACADPTLAALGTGWDFVIATEPTAGAQLHTGFHLRGCGDVFEASFGWRLRDAAGAILVDDNAMMSCGTGCVGTFDLAISYPPQSQPQLGSLEVYTTSMADGAEQLRGVIPIVLH